MRRPQVKKGKEKKDKKEKKDSLLRVTEWVCSKILGIQFVVGFRGSDSVSQRLGSFLGSSGLHGKDEGLRFRFWGLGCVSSRAFWNDALTSPNGKCEEKKQKKDKSDTSVAA